MIRNFFGVMLDGGPVDEAIRAAASETAAAAQRCAGTWLKPLGPFGAFLGDGLRALAATMGDRLNLGSVRVAPDILGGLLAPLRALHHTLGQVPKLFQGKLTVKDLLGGGSPVRDVAGLLLGAPALEWPGIEGWAQDRLPDPGPADGADGPRNGEALFVYYERFFRGAYRDRNGVDLRFSGPGKLDSLEVSPKLAGQLAYILVDFLGDGAFRVPFHAAEVLSAHEEHRRGRRRAAELLEARRATIGAIDRLMSDDAIGGRIHRDPGLREEILRLDAQDREAVALKERLSAFEGEGREKRLARARRRFTCFRAGVIPAEIPGLFIDGRVPGGGDEAIGGPDDHADVVGSVVAQAAAGAEKSARSAIGGLGRGGGPTAVNNEVVAEVLAAAVGGVAKKVTEAFVHRLLARIVTEPAVLADGVALPGGRRWTKAELLARLRRIHGEDDDLGD